jgi:myo-inositol-1-phosphate synthase
VEYYKNASADEEIPGLMHTTIGGYLVRDIEFSSAIDVFESKVGLDLSKAIWAEPNNTVKFEEVHHLGIPVSRGMTHDGLGKYLLQKAEKAEKPTDDITGILKDTKQMWPSISSQSVPKWRQNGMLNSPLRRVVASLMASPYLLPVLLIGAKDSKLQKSQLLVTIFKVR